MIYTRKENISTWDINSIFCEGKNTYNKIIEVYISNFKNELNDDIFIDLLEKINLKFYEIEKNSKNEEDKYSQMYDFLNDMFASIEDVLSYESNK